MRDPFAHTLRAGSAYRRDRLRVEQERLLRRLRWAISRDDDATADWLEARLDDVEAELEADLRPGKAAGRFDGYRVLNR